MIYNCSLIHHNMHSNYLQFTIFSDNTNVIVVAGISLGTFLIIFITIIVALGIHYYRGRKGPQGIEYLHILILAFIAIIETRSDYSDNQTSG